MAVIYTDDFVRINGKGDAIDFIENEVDDSDRDNVSTFLPQLSDAGEIDQVALATQIKEFLINLVGKNAKDANLSPLSYPEIVKVLKKSFTSFIFKNLPASDVSAGVMRQLLATMLVNKDSPLQPFVKTLFE